MKPSEVIAKADRNRPNMLTTEDKYFALNEIEGRVYNEILMLHVHPADLEKPHYAPPENEEPADDNESEQQEETEEETEEETTEEPDMLVPDDYAKLYWYWLYCEIDDVNQETERYNADRALFEDAWGNFGDYWTRTHMPLTASAGFSV